MKIQTVQLDPLQQLVIERLDNGQVKLSLVAVGATLYTKTIAPDVAFVAGRALVRSSLDNDQVTTI